jgi:hypothetical protein
VITILQQHILQTHQTPHTTLPSNMPTAVPELNRGSNATITMSREYLMALSVKKLKHLLKERDLPAGHAAKSTLVDRLLEGKKKAPKSNAEPPQVVGRLGVGSAGQFRDCYGADGL